jgi:hypothetical protein
MSTLHVIRMDMLLFALGGFANEPNSRNLGRRRYTQADRNLVAEFYRQHSLDDGPLQYGQAKRLATLLNRDYNSLRTSIYRMRRRGELPTPIKKRA